MRYFLHAGTLFIRGSFRALPSENPGSVARVSTLLIRSTPARPGRDEAADELALAVDGAGYGREYLGITSRVPVQNLCVLQYDFITVFIIAGTPTEDDAGPVTAGIIICSGRAMSDAALRETLATAADAGATILAGCGPAGAGTPRMPVIVASEGAEARTDGGVLSAIRDRVRAALLQGIPEALRRTRDKTGQDRPAFFIFSRFKGEHWVEWTPEDCPYYPCHFAGQRCDFCYCPLYPCGDEALGQWAESANGGKVWNCARCTMIHEPEVADYLKTHPEAEKDELIRVWKGQKT